MAKEHKQPAWVVQAYQLYANLRDRAVVDEYGSLLFTGKIVDMYREVGASSSHFTRIKGLLVESGAIAFRQVGNRHQQSVIEITGELSPIGELVPPEHLTASRHAATVVGEIQEDVDSLLAWRESLLKGDIDIGEVLRNFEKRISKLEQIDPHK